MTDSRDLITFPAVLPGQEAQDEVNDYLRGMTARGFVPSQETVNGILARHPPGTTVEQ